jgi:lipid II:glycine glycyltransferase (peptidoglycan interpeptide bridge formation enzyme)
LKVEPDEWQENESGLSANLAGFRPGGIPVQPRSTILIDLSGPESAWLERMKQKTRYNIRLAERKEIQVCPSSDIASFHAMMKVTGGRDGFGVHTLAYYQKAYDLFHSSGKVELLVADYEKKPLAGLMIFAQGKRAWYLYGASSDEERSRMPAYLLQWEAMRWAKSRGCESYDLWGVPDEEESQLEAQFEGRHDGLWGVYRFKRGFGGQIKRAAQTWERVYNAPLYALYRYWGSRREDTPRG